MAIVKKNMTRGQLVQTMADITTKSLTTQKLYVHLVPLFILIYFVVVFKTYSPSNPISNVNSQPTQASNPYHTPIYTQLAADIQMAVLHTITGDPRMGLLESSFAKLRAI